MLGVPIYFCHAYHSWEKGSIENYNKQVRRYVKKGTDISQYPAKYLAMTADRLNDRFMSVLGYRTPAECLAAHRNNTKKNSPANAGLRGGVLLEGYR